MSLDGVDYPAIHLCRVILSRTVESFCSQHFMVLSDESSVPVLSSQSVYTRLCLPFNATLIRSINHLFKTLHLPSGEGALKYTVYDNVRRPHNDCKESVALKSDAMFLWVLMIYYPGFLLYRDQGCIGLARGGGSPSRWSGLY